MVLGVKLLYTLIKNRVQYMDLLRVESKLKKDKDKYTSLLKIFNSLDNESLKEVIRFSLPEEKFKNLDIEAFKAEWNKLPEAEKLQFMVIPGIEKALSKFIMKVPEEATPQIDPVDKMNKSFLEKVNVLPADLIIKDLKEKYPEAGKVALGSHVLDGISQAEFTDIWSKFEDEIKLNLLGKKYDNDEFCLLFQIRGLS
jgi:hypothetical protein